MILLRQKIFYEKLNYYSKLERIKESLKYALSLGLVGATFGSIFGFLIGRKRGAKIVGSLGGGLGFLSGLKIGAVETSNVYVDRENAKREKAEKLQQEIDKDPSILFKDLKDDGKLIREIRGLETKYGVKFPDQFYKLIKIRKQFIPTLVDWYKRYKNPNCFGIIYSIIPSVIESELRESKLDNKYSDNVLLLIDPEMADDTFILYYPESDNGKYFGYDITESRGTLTTLKEAIISDLDYKLKELSNLYDKSELDLLKKYKQFISSKL